MKQGISLLEMLIVLAILAILSAVLVPNFISATARARLRTDVQSAQLIQNMMDLYHAERGTPITASSAVNTLPEVLARLREVEMLSAGLNDAQTEGADFVMDNNRRVFVDISGSPNNVLSNAANWLTPAQMRYVRTTSGTP